MIIRDLASLNASVNGLNTEIANTQSQYHVIHQKILQAEIAQEKSIFRIV
jgi:hypothetical protein